MIKKLWWALTGRGPRVVDLGVGNWMIGAASYEGSPAVFLRPAKPPGVPGQLVPGYKPTDNRMTLQHGDVLLLFKGASPGESLAEVIRESVKANPMEAA